MAPLGLWNPAYPVLDFFAADPADLARALYHDLDSPVARAAAEIPREGDPYVHYTLERAKSLATAAKYLWPIPNRGLNKRLHRVKAPTLLVWGASDGLCPSRYGDDFRAGIKNAELVVLKNAGHLLQVECPAKVAELVGAFLDR
jgi:pimeloyl-ACP methyl ester carboxylesterase